MALGSVQPNSKIGLFPPPLLIILIHDVQSVDADGTPPEVATTLAVFKPGVVYILEGFCPIAEKEPSPIH